MLLLSSSRFLFIKVFSFLKFSLSVFLFLFWVLCKDVEENNNKNPEIIETSSHRLHVETSAAKINQSNGCCHRTIAGLMSVSRVAYRSSEPIDDPLSSATFHVIPGAPFAARFLFSLFHRLRGTMPPPPGSGYPADIYIFADLSRASENHSGRGKKGIGDRWLRKENNVPDGA